jgi:hypothetical protein
MQINKKFYTILFYLFLYIFFSAHSPWGQYLAYREQHLLIMSTREDEPTYPFSKILVEKINVNGRSDITLCLYARDTLISTPSFSTI